MNAARRALAAELYADGRADDAAQADRLVRWRNVEPETAQLLALLVRGTGARRVLEIGTSNGYSTVWLGDAAGASNSDRRLGRARGMTDKRTVRRTA